MHRNSPPGPLESLVAMGMAVSLMWLSTDSHAGEHLKKLFATKIHVVTPAEQGLNHQVSAALKNMEFPDQQPPGVEKYRYSDYTIYITGGQATRESLDRFYSMTSTFLDRYGSKPYLDDKNYEKQVPDAVRIENYWDTESEPWDRYNADIKGWAQHIHLGNASAIGAVRHSIIEGTLPGTPLCLETALRMESRMRATIADLSSRVHQYERETTWSDRHGGYCPKRKRNKVWKSPLRKLLKAISGNDL